jgi:excisionase family DNA binding protein
MATATVSTSAREERYSVEDAAQQFGLSHWTVRAWCRAGRLEHYKLGRKIFISGSEINRVIDQAKVQR